MGGVPLRVAVLAWLAACSLPLAGLAQPVALSGDVASSHSSPTLGAGPAIPRPSQQADAGAMPLRPGTMRARLAACTACHGEQGKAGADGYYPRLAGKPQAYLFQQLQHFRDGQRRYAPMTELLVGLPDAYLHDMAGWFAAQSVPYPAPLRPTASPTQLERGRVLATAGDARLGLPACTACHGATLSGVLPAIPGVLGLPQDYLASQLGGWQGGLRHAAAPDCMADVARALTPADLAAVASWLAAQPVPTPYQPVARDAVNLPMACGSQTQD